ncbi:uncharacterized protein SPPG_09567 [Spizellomyces punctatus DAOM BR117]|uniref:Uncharacterized protein n=1 Tax=Spizellomyces punctatus (strain DAOM BR117) TaxID=645134 RepID=A0A0L0H413_SPIPD|nr:uncharacterized protein SPPG_09567 [Spizellomyces punctatus DAOM BR117]KNC95942.1 hypothetical protein SPPG_09567 [Spizellomyces punctatus DAOM BR117]|eukprot:XP_016603982.1 hypothetical protein SPPG_09567 [Spizellomyces punctatus DAOM BR117]
MTTSTVSRKRVTSHVVSRGRSRSKTTTERERRFISDGTYDHSGIRKMAQRVVMSVPEEPLVRRPSEAAPVHTIYPSWWGHREHQGLRPHTAYSHPVRDAVVVETTGAFSQNWSYPKRMVDEMTQTANNAQILSRLATHERNKMQSQGVNEFFVSLANNEEANEVSETHGTLNRREKPLEGRRQDSESSQHNQLSKHKTTVPDESVFATTTTEAAVQSRQVPPQHFATFTICAPSASNKPPPTLLEIASNFLKSDIIHCLDLRALEVESDGDDDVVEAIR